MLATSTLLSCIEYDFYILSLMLVWADEIAVQVGLLLCRGGQV